MSLLDSITTNENIHFLIILIITIVVVTLSFLFLKIIVNRRARQKKTYGEFIFKQISKPVFAIIFFIGLYTATELLTSLDKYKLLIDGSFFIIFTFIIALLISRILTVLMHGWFKARYGFERTPGLLNKIVTAIIYIISFCE